MEEDMETQVATKVATKTKVAVISIMIASLAVAGLGGAELVRNSMKLKEILAPGQLKKTEQTFALTEFIRELDNFEEGLLKKFEGTANYDAYMVFHSELDGFEQFLLDNFGVEGTLTLTQFLSKLDNFKQDFLKKFETSVDFDIYMVFWSELDGFEQFLLDNFGGGEILLETGSIEAGQELLK